MKPTALFCAALATLAPHAAAQSPNELAQIEAMYPDCALLCLEQLIPKSSCAEWDVACRCTNQELILRVTECASTECTTYEGLQTLNATLTMCGSPVRDKSMQPLAIGMVFGALALVAFILRMCSTLPHGGRAIGMDDYMIIMTVVLAAPPTAFAVTLVNNGLGKDMWTLPLKNIENVLMYYYLGEIFYFGAITANKLSILCFVLRVFPEQKFRRVTYCVCGICIAYGLSFIFATMFQCSPIQYSWLQIESDVEGTCNNIHLQGWLSAIFNIVIDLLIIILPLKKLWALHMPLKKKFMVTVLFSLGIFVTIISVVRLNSLILFANSANITWDYTEAAWWSTLEIHVGIICACLPAIRVLFITFGATVLKTKNSSLGAGKSTGYSSNQERSGFSKNNDERDFMPLVDMPGRGKAFDSHSGIGVAISESQTGTSV